MTYNGHKNWNHWNVSLWIANDEGLYRLAKRCIRMGRNRTDAAKRFLECMDGIKATPDGAPYTVTSVMAALRDL
jgi:hypothetical protein